MAFDPDAFLAQGSAPAQDFNPDAFLSGQPQPEVDTRTAQDVEQAQAKRIDALPELTGILAGQDKLKVAALSPVLLATTDPQEFGQVLEKNFPEIGVVQTPEGEFIAVNNKTRQAVSINKPGLSQADIIQGLGVAASFFPAAKLASIPATLGGKVAAGAATSGLTQAAIEGVQSAVGGEVSPTDIGLATGLGGAAEVLLPAASAIRQAVRPSASAVTPEAQAARAAVEGVEEATGQAIGLFPAQQTMDPTQLLTQRLLPQLQGGARKATEALKRQNEQVFNATARLIEQTGAADSLTRGAGRFKTAAENAVAKAKSIRAEKASPLYREAFKDNARVDIEPVKVAVDLALDNFPEGGKIAGVINKAGNVINNAKSIRELHGAKLEIDELINARGDSSLTNTAKNELKNIQQSLLAQIDEASPIYAQARAEFAAASPAVEEVSQGIIGRIANKENLKSISKDIFDAQEVNPSVIKNAKKVIDEVDPQAWNDILSIELQRRIGGLKELISESPDAVANTPAQIKRALFGNPANRKVLLAGMDTKQRANFRYLEDLLGRAAAGRASGSPTAPFEAIKDKLRGTSLVVRDALFSPIKTVGSAGEQSIIERNTAALADLSFSPAFVDDLARIRVRNQNTPATVKALTQLIDDALESQDQGNEE